MTPKEFQAAAGVGDDVLARLEAYAAVLVKWQARINLVGPDTVPDLWRRHMLDSAQVFPHLPTGAKRVVDFGSGAGFPGLVLAIMGAPDVHLVESDARKGAFLREAARISETAVTIHIGRIEALAPLGADVVTARALAPLAKLLDLAERHATPATHYLFLKGKGSEDELTLARKEWNITSDRVPSLSDPAGVLLHLHEVRRGRA